MPANEHGDTAAEDVEPCSLLLHQRTASPSKWLARASHVPAAEVLVLFLHLLLWILVFIAYSGKTREILFIMWERERERFLVVCLVVKRFWGLYISLIILAMGYMCFYLFPTQGRYCPCWFLVLISITRTSW